MKAGKLGFEVGFRIQKFNKGKRISKVVKIDKRFIKVSAYISSIKAG